MASYTLTPTSIFENVNTTDTGGGGLAADINDASDATGAQFLTGYNRLKVEMSTVVLGAGERIVGIRPNARWDTGVGRIAFFMYLESGVTGNSGFTDSFTSEIGTVQWFNGAYRNYKPWTTDAWDQAELDAIRWVGFDSDSGTTKPFIREVSVDVLTNVKPTVNVTGPASPVTTTTRPTLTWSYSDTEGDPCQRSELKVFTNAVHGGGGFDPETSTPLWSTTLYDASVSKKMTIELANGTYWFYVKSSDAYGFSDWDGDAWVQNVVLPTAPVLTVTQEPANGRAKIHVAPAEASLVVELEADYGSGWEAVLGATDAAVAYPAGTDFYDYAIPPYGTVLYRARFIKAYGTDDPIASSYSATTTITAAIPGWWLKSTTDPTKNLRIYVSNFTVKARLPQGSYDAFGRTDSITMTDGRKGDIGSLKIWSKTAAQYASLQTLISLDEPLLLVDGTLNRKWYIRMGEETSFEMQRSTPDAGSAAPLRHFNAVSFDWRQVRKPS